MQTNIKSCDPVMIPWNSLENIKWITWKIKKIIADVNWKVTSIITFWPLLWDIIWKYKDNIEHHWITSPFHKSNDIFEMWMVLGFWFIVSLYVSSVLKDRNIKEESLNQKNKFLQELIDTIPHPVFYKDSSQKYVMCNEMFWKFIWKTKAETIWKDLFTLFPDNEFVDSVENACRDAISNNSRWAKIYEGNLPWYDWEVEIYYSSFQNDAGNEKWIIWTIVDITEHKNNIRLTEQVNRILNHELKTPLNWIINIPDILLNDGESLTSNQRELIQLIKHWWEDMLNQVNCSLDILKLEKWTYKWEFTQINLEDIFNKINLFLCSDINENGPIKNNKIEYYKNWELSTLDWEFMIESDENMLFHLFQNVIKNALESHDYSKWKIKVLLTENENEFLVQIVNNKEIPKEIQNVFFDKHVTHWKRNGTGYWTYLSKMIVDFLGWKIAFDTWSDWTELSMILPKTPKLQSSQVR
jgi:signal transduction histidine kinase